jgi:hypothetical protein
LWVGERRGRRWGIRIVSEHTHVIYLLHVVEWKRRWRFPSSPISRWWCSPEEHDVLSIDINMLIFQLVAQVQVGGGLLAEALELMEARGLRRSLFVLPLQLIEVFLTNERDWIEKDHRVVPWDHSGSECLWWLHH